MASDSKKPKMEIPVSSDQESSDIEFPLVSTTESFPLGQLPMLCIEAIAKHLSNKDVAACCAVSRDVREAFDIKGVWKPRYDEDRAKYLLKTPCKVDPGFAYSEAHKGDLNPPSEWKLGFIVENHFLNNWRQGKFKEEKIKIAKGVNDCITHFKFLTNDYVAAVSQKSIDIFCVRNYPFKLAIEPIPVTSTNFFIDKLNDDLIVVYKDNVKVYQLDFCTEQWNVKLTFAVDLSQAFFSLDDINSKSPTAHMVLYPAAPDIFVIIKNYLVLCHNEDSTLHIWNVESGVKEKEEKIPIENSKVMNIACTKTNFIIILQLTQIDDYFFYAYDLSKYVFLPFKLKREIKIWIYSDKHRVFGDHIAFWSGFECKLNIYNYRTNETKLSDYHMRRFSLAPLGDDDVIILKDDVLKLFRCSTGEFVDLLYQITGFQILSDKFMMFEKIHVDKKDGYVDVKFTKDIYELVSSNTLRKSSPLTALLSFSMFEIIFNQYFSRYIKAKSKEDLQVFHFW